MEISNNTGFVNNTARTTTTRTRSKKTNTSNKTDAVSIFIDPATLRSEAYRLIQLENNHFPIHNPYVLTYDNQLHLQMYEK